VTTVRNGLVRITRAWRALATEQRHAAVASIALFLTMILPWYGKTGFDEKLNSSSENLNAFGVFGWVEAAIFLVSLGILLLLFYRGEQRAFHLPGGDGTVIVSAGLWSAFLLLWRVFDRPGVSGKGVTIGIQWGFFFAFLAAGALAYAGFRLRTAARVHEPTRAEDPTTQQEPAPPPRPQLTHSRERRRRRPAGSEAETQIAGQLSFDDTAEEPPPPPPLWRSS
jgi:hypothetical protein